MAIIYMLTINSETINCFFIYVSVVLLIIILCLLVLLRKKNVKAGCVGVREHNKTEITALDRDAGVIKYPEPVSRDRYKHHVKVSDSQIIPVNSCKPEVLQEERTLSSGLYSALDASEFLYFKSCDKNDFIANKEYFDIVVKLFLVTYSKTNKALFESGGSRIKSLLNLSELLVKSAYSCTRDSSLFQDQIGFMYYRVCDYFFVLIENRIRIDAGYSQVHVKGLPANSPKTKKSVSLVYSFWLECLNESLDEFTNEGKYLYS